MYKLLPVVFVIMLVMGCATIQDHRNFEQPLNQVLIASVGTTLVRMNRESDLPNVYGGKDIYGGKVDRGFIEVKLVEISGTELTLLVSDISRQSSETTMDRYVVPQSSVNVSQTVNITNSDQGAILVKINAGSDKEFVVGGVRITFNDIRASSVTYRLDDLMSQ